MKSFINVTAERLRSGIASRVAIHLTVLSALAALAALSRFADVAVAKQAPRTATSRTPCIVDTPSSNSPEMVATDRGVLRGMRAGNSDVFKGIPYAAPPVGDLRWRPPQNAPCWSGVRDATAFGEVCAQLGARPGATTTWFGSENCLYLNVWTPRERQTSERLPVLFFLHGGGNTRGAGSETVATTVTTLGPNTQDGQTLAEQHRAIVVTSNYRLGMLGFLAHPALSRENGRGASGNYGMMDQIAALDWVQRNIASFGGDPTRVLAFGHSAGARDVCGLMVAQAGQRWFSRVGVLSASCENFPSLERAETIGQTWATRAGCATAQDAQTCLRRLSTEQAVAAFEQPRRLFANDYFQVGPIVDGVLVSDQPVAFLASKQGASLPLLVSSSDNEVAFSLFPLMFTGSINTAGDYDKALQSLAPAAIVEGIKRVYPLADFATPRQALTAVLTDANLVCPARRASRTVAAAGGTVWRALWTHTVSNGPARPFGPAHVIDQPFWLKTLSQMPNFVPTPREVALADSMARYLVAFAATGDPNYTGGVKWPPYDSATDTHLVLDDVITVGRGVHTRACDFWDTNLLPVGYRIRP